MKNKLSKNLIAILITLCTIMSMVTFAFADYNVYKLDVDISHGKNDIYAEEDTPQWSDVLSARLTSKGVKVEPDSVKWYRLITEKRDSKDSTIIIRQKEDRLVGTDLTYTVDKDDIGFCIRCDVTINGQTVSHTTSPVEKKNYGEPVLKVDDNSYYGATDGKIYYLDQRMQYTHNQTDIFDVDNELAILPSGPSTDNLSQNGYSWYVRFKETDTIQQGDWYLFVIMPGAKYSIEDLTLNYNEFTLTSGKDSVTLHTTVTPEHAYIETEEWKSSDESVAVVRRGTVYAVADGTATISYILNEGLADEHIATCDITVENLGNVQYVSFDDEEITLSMTSASLKTALVPTTVAAPDNADYVQTVYSEDTSVVKATMASNNKVFLTAEGPGETNIVTMVTQPNGITLTSVATVIVIDPKVSNDYTWNTDLDKEQKGLTFTFKDFTPDENVTVMLSKGSEENYETVNSKNYTLDKENNKITLSYDYLSSKSYDTYYIKFVIQEKSEKADEVSAKSMFEISNAAFYLVPSDATLNPNNRTIDLIPSTENVEGEKKQLVYEWSSSDETIAKVTAGDGKGTVEGLSNVVDSSSVIITCTAYYKDDKGNANKNQKYGTAHALITVKGFEVLVNAYLGEDSVLLESRDTVSIDKTLKPYIDPESCQDYSEAWTFEDTSTKGSSTTKNVISIDPVSRTITPEREGTATVTYTVTQKGRNGAADIVKTDTCDIRVKLYDFKSYSPTNRSIEAFSKNTISYIIEGIPDDFKVDSDSLIVKVNKSGSTTTSTLKSGTNYSLVINEDGTLTVTLNSSYLKYKTTGVYYITFIFEDGELDSDFTITKATSTSIRRGSAKDAHTGDDNYNIVWIALAGLSLTGGLVLGRKLKKKTGHN